MKKIRMLVMAVLLLSNKSVYIIAKLINSEAKIVHSRWFILYGRIRDNNELFLAMNFLSALPYFLTPGGKN
ncbi:MAG: hypothetical protein M1405_01360, partial [Patescibacteria group bacterium]|nr:hypothetical protein [Patescibacteria group bacterium]